jgi:hypothetical protein
VQNNDQRRNLTQYIIAVTVLISCIAILTFSDFGKSRTVIYDCRDAHWHPDVPIEVKKECSRLIYEEWKRRQDERKNDPSIHENREHIFRT